MAQGNATRGEDDRDLGEVLELLRSIWALDHALQLASKRMHRSLGVTGPQRLVVRIIGRFPRLTPGDLARVLHLHPSTLTGVLRRLEQRGLVRRQRDPDDGRRAFLSLTARGRSIDAAKAGTIEASVRRALQEVTARDLEGAHKVLRHLAVTVS